MTTPHPRRLTGGRTEGDAYVLVLDGGQEVETLDEAVAHQAATYMRAGQAFEIDLEPRVGRRPMVIELRPVTPAAPKPAASSTALTTAPALPKGLISRPDELATQLRAMQAHYNVLTPAIAVSEMAPGFGANLAIVQIDPTVTFDERGNGTGPDTYHNPTIHRGSPDQRSLNKSGLQKIAQALGIQWDQRACRRLDDMKERHYWMWKYVGYVRMHDGQLQTVEGSRELDLRDGSAEAAGMKPDQLRMARAMGNQLCETKAMQRAIRTYVRQVYTVAELQKPFLIVRFSFTPDMSDPEIKKLVTQQAMAGIGALYQTPPGHILPPTESAAELAALPAATEGAPTTATDTPGPSAPAAQPAKPNPFAPTAASEAPAAPLPPDAVFVQDVVVIKSKPSAPKAWLLYKATFSDGEVATTFDAAFQQVLADAKAAKTPVRKTTEENPGYDNRITALTPIDTRQPILPGTEGQY